jgi:hypothetical protein
MINILVFPCGSEIGLEIHRSLKNSKNFHLIGASSVDDHGRFVYDDYVELPNIDDQKIWFALKRMIDDREINYIFPAHDSVVLKLSRLNNVITSTFKTCFTCRSKAKTYQLFKGIIPVPEYAKDYPMFLKPDIGQGSKGCHLVMNKRERDFYIWKDLSLLALEYLPGKEYTIDCFTDRHGKLLFAGGRERVRINNGISVNSKPVKNLIFQEYAEKINQTLKFRGVWFFQVKERKGELVLMEIAPRIAGTMALYRNLGINFAELSIWDKIGEDVSIIKNDFDIEIDRALYASYKTNLKYSNVYIDLDDTLIIDGKINHDLVRIIYKAKGEGKKIILITKHEGDVKEYLTHLFYIFDKIIQLNKGENKSKYMETDSIFIDDSFKERKEVFETLHIPVFGINEIEAL